MSKIIQKHEYYISGIEIEDLRVFINGMIEAHEFDHELEFDIKFPPGSSSFYQSFLVPGTRETKHYTNKIILFPVKGEGSLITTQLEIHKTKEDLPDSELPKALPVTWDKLQAKLDRFGFDASNRDGSEIVSIDHRYIDPSMRNIPNPRHKAVIKALIKAEAGPIYEPGKPPKWKTDKEIGEEFGYSPSQMSWIKNHYMRPEFKKKKNKEEENSE